jgi:tetratricopeptide (TPR) repeat protein
VALSGEIARRAEQLDERLATLDKAAELEPRGTEAYDQRVRALAGAERWDEALAACRPAVFGDHRPPDLRADEAWVEAQRGNLPAAIQQMQLVVADEPQYFAGWNMLAEWYAKLQDHAHYLEAAEAMVRISPHYEVSHGYLGEARQQSGDAAGAMEAYRRAFALNPQYEFAGNGLFDLLVAAGDLEQAAATLRTLQTHGDTPFVLAREAQLATKQNDMSQAGELLDQFCADTTGPGWLVQVTVQAIVEAQAPGTAEAVLERRLTEPTANPEVGRQWVLLQVQRGHWRFVQRLQPLFRDNRPVGEQAVYAYIEALYLGNHARDLRSFVRRNESWLRNSDFVWGGVGYALAGVRDYAAATNWVHDWRSRQDAKPDAGQCRRDCEPPRGCQKRLPMSVESRLDMPADHGTWIHYLWLATDAAGDGDANTAQKCMQHIDINSLTPITHCWQLACRRSSTCRKHCGHGRQVFRQVRRSMAAAQHGYAAFVNEPARRRAYYRCAKQVATYRGRWLAWLWYYWVRLYTFSI